MTFEILTTSKIEQFNNVEFIEIETISGNFVIQPGYAPTIFILKPNHTISFGAPENRQERYINHGLLEINREHALLFISL